MTDPTTPQAASGTMPITGCGCPNCRHLWSELAAALKDAEQMRTHYRALLQAVRDRHGKHYRDFDQQVTALAREAREG